MNPNSSYVVPNYPQLQQKNQNMDPMLNEANNMRNLNKPATKEHILYYSTYCKHCNKLLSFLQQNEFENGIDFRCIDARFVKDNVTYILNRNEATPLPPMVNSVPTLCLMPNFEILTGNKIVEYFKPLTKSVQAEREVINSEPNPYCLEKETIGSYGVSSDAFSFYDATDKELSASGDGGLRQMYNYSAISGGTNVASEQHIYTPQDEGREQKMTMSMEQLQQRRNNEI